jgi:hypothetical protein
VAEADAENGDAAEKLLNIFDGVAYGLGVTGAVRKENAVGLQFHDVLSGHLRRHDPDIAVMIDEKAQDILLDAEVVGSNAEFARVGNPAGFAHGFGPRRNSELDGAFLPAVGFLAGDVARELLSGHQRNLFGFVDQLVGWRAVGGHDAAKRTDVANVAYERARIDIPDGGNFVAIQIKLSGFGGAPVRRDLRKFADDKRFDIRTRRFFIVKIRADIANVRIGEANDLAGVAGIGENFLITGEAGIENDFAAAARDGASRAAVKYAPVFQSESGGSVLNFVQCVLQEWS